MRSAQGENLLGVIGQIAAQAKELPVPLRAAESRNPEVRCAACACRNSSARGPGITSIERWLRTVSRSRR